MNDNNTPRRPRIAVNIDAFPFLLPYFERQFEGYEIVDTPADDIVAAVMVSSTDVYNVTNGQMLGIDTPVADNAMARAEQQFTDQYSHRNIPVVILRCPHIVATGMEGLPMRLARGMARMTMFKIRDNNAMISLVHGVDIAHAAYDLVQAKVSGTFIMTDGTETPLNELLDALSVRLSDKRVYTIKPRWARWLYGKTYYTQLTTTLTFSNDKISQYLTFSPNKVTQYLTHHVYDENSL